MGDVASRGPLAGLELEFVGDRLKKGFKRRDTFKGGIATLGALAMATGVGRHATAAQGLASLGLLPEDLPEKKYTAATSEVGAASTWVSHGMDVAKFFGDLLGVEVTSFDGEVQRRAAAAGPAVDRLAGLRLRGGPPVGHRRPDRRGRRRSSPRAPR